MSGIGTVLYAEDDENDAFFMERAFSRLKNPPQLRIVPSGRSAIDYLSSENQSSGGSPPPAFVLLDVKMPELSGLEVLAWIRARNEFARVPVILFTSSTQGPDVEFSRTHGANAYLVKPSNADNLAALIEELLFAIARGIDAGEPLAVGGNLL